GIPTILANSKNLPHREVVSVHPLLLIESAEKLNNWLLQLEKVVERRKIEASLKIISSNSIPVTLGL
ncbi:hypothetical protein D5086_010870, partial [Populus alba]